jgi:hypothetical protein
MANPDEVFPVIDFHAHVIEPEVYKQTIAHSVATGFGARPMDCRSGSPLWNLFGGMIDPEIQIRDMDQKGIDIGVISTSTVVQFSRQKESASMLQKHSSFRFEKEWRAVIGGSPLDAKRRGIPIPVSDINDLIERVFRLTLSARRSSYGCNRARKSIPAKG